MKRFNIKIRLFLLILILVVSSLIFLAVKVEAKKQAVWWKNLPLGERGRIGQIQQDLNELSVGDFLVTADDQVWLVTSAYKTESFKVKHSVFDTQEETWTNSRQKGHQIDKIIKPKDWSYEQYAGQLLRQR